MNRNFNFTEGEILLINKPLHWTSFDVVNKLRFAIMRSRFITSIGSSEINSKPKRIKVGHAGTLDPLATGLLVVCTGKKTKAIDGIQNGEKEYTGTIQLGGITPTYDAEMPVSEKFPVSHISEQLIRTTAQQFVGEISQMPPVFSAIKIKGQPAYVKARKGIIPEMTSRSIFIKEFEIKDFDPEKYNFRFRVVCSKGTYIRSLAHDVGKALHSGAYLSSLCRTRIGDFSLNNAVELAEFVDYLQKNEE